MLSFALLKIRLLFRGQGWYFFLYRSCKRIQYISDKFSGTNRSFSHFSTNSRLLHIIFNNVQPTRMIATAKTSWEGTSLLQWYHFISSTALRAAGDANAMFRKTLHHSALVTSHISIAMKHYSTKRYAGAMLPRSKP